jgi:hypothetical protein
MNRHLPLTLPAWQSRVQSPEVVLVAMLAQLMNWTN